MEFCAESSHRERLLRRHVMRFMMKNNESLTLDESRVRMIHSFYGDIHICQTVNIPRD